MFDTTGKIRNVSCVYGSDGRFKVFDEAEVPLSPDDDNVFYGETPTEALVGWIAAQGEDVFTDVIALREYSHNVPGWALPDINPMWATVVHLTREGGEYVASIYGNSVVMARESNARDAIREGINIAMMAYDPLVVQQFRIYHDYSVGVDGKATSVEHKVRHSI